MKADIRGELISIHPTSSVHPGAEVGSGTKVWQFCTILEGAKIGQDCNISQNVYIEGRTRIGNRVKIKNNVSVYELVELGDDVFCGPSMVFTNVINPRSHWSRKDEFKRTLVQQGATIGANATIVCGITIGRYAMIGAGSVVTRDVPDFALVYGVPAVQKGWVCFCGNKLDIVLPAHVKCSLCGRDYELKNNLLHESGTLK